MTDKLLPAPFHIPQIPQFGEAEVAQSDTSSSTDAKSSPSKTAEQKALSDIQKEILDKRTPFDFIKRHNADIYKRLEDDKFQDSLKEILRGTIVKPDDEAVAMYTAEILQDDFKKLSYSIATIGDEINIYDGLDWRPLAYKEAQHFLSSYLKKAGLPKSKAESATAIERYFKQLSFSLYRSVPVIKDEKAMINALNYTIEIDRKGNITQRNHSEYDYCFYVLSYAYAPDAKAPLFHKFLDEVLSSDIQCVLQEFFGTCFMRELKHEKVLCNIGAGANGKSVLAEVVRYVLGSENVTSFSINSLCDEKSTTRNNINHKLLNYSTDFSGKIWNNGIFKQLASGEPVEARRLYHDSTIINDYARLAFNSNFMPDSNDTSSGFLRRLLLVEFNKTIPVEKRDPNLANKLCQEAPGILNWMIDGLVRFIKNGYKFSDSSTLSTSMQTFQAASDNVKSFMDSMSYQPGTGTEMKLSDLYSNYKNYCSVNSIKSVENMANFKIKLEGLHYQIESKNKKAIKIHLDRVASIINPF